MKLCSVDKAALASRNWSILLSGILLRGAGLVDEVTDDDVTKEAVQLAYKLSERPDQNEVLQIAEAWRPYRMWAIVLLHVWLRREMGGPHRQRV
jgi:3-methyladenine DNA glycosylase/8-oxoguanine DNA glycosylase